ncbi:polysaccharide deacetylase family protein [Winogradskyella poriferorum]|uniref:polysaccharide deacetylase family protein n=1 Tax=Winogradskyella poriferorum TaxID=307627 RepID=UPI003D65E428
MKKSFGILVILILLYACDNKPYQLEFTYPQGKHKALVLSYDDGTIQDIDLVKLFDKHNLIGTFNLNSGYLDKTIGWPLQNGDTIFQRYVPKDSLNIIYKNHEIAVHGELHKNFLDISDEDILKEIDSDIKVIRNATNKDIRSMAYPFGNTTPHIAQLISKTGLINGRTIADTHQYGFPENYFMWHPTCHDSRVMEHLDSYLKLNNKELSLLYVWGHSWEFDDENRWKNMIVFCEAIAMAEDIWFVSHGELTEYLLSTNKVKIEGNKIYNPEENPTVWITLSDGPKKINPGETLILSDYE